MFFEEYGAGMVEGESPGSGPTRSAPARALRARRMTAALGAGYVVASVAVLATVGVWSLRALAWAGWGVAVAGVGALLGLTAWRTVTRARFFATGYTPHERPSLRAQYWWVGLCLCVVLSLLLLAGSLTWVYQASLPLVRVPARVEHCVHGRAVTCRGQWSFDGVTYRGTIAGVDVHDGAVVTTGIRPDDPSRTHEPDPSGATGAFALFTVASSLVALLSWWRWRRHVRPFRDRLLRRMRDAAAAGGGQPAG